MNDLPAVSMAQGGDFVSGALIGAISAGASLTMDQSGIDALGQSGDGIPEKIAARTAVAGGTASVLSGGKFANGAITVAFAQMYNAEGGAALARGATAALAVEATEGNPIAAIGMMTVGVLSGTKLAYDAITVHANSSQSSKGTELHFLINKTTADIDKIGVTSNPATRYSQAWLAQEGVGYVPQARFSWSGAAYPAEWIELKNYYQENGRLRRLNKIFR